MTDALNQASPARLLIHQSVFQSNLHQDNAFANDVRTGLTTQPKTLQPKYFYDALGSQLFEAICLLPEYYPTRAETEIFERHAADIVRQLSGPISVVELGSGSSVKTRLLIEAILADQPELHYQPMDISASILEQSAESLLGNYDRLRITGHVGDYTRKLGAITRDKEERLLALFLGSNIGNYTTADAHDLLRTIRQALQTGDGLLLGADLKKSAQILVSAYDDAAAIAEVRNRGYFPTSVKKVKKYGNPAKSVLYSGAYKKTGNKVGNQFVNVLWKMIKVGFIFAVGFAAALTAVSFGILKI